MKLEPGSLVAEKYRIEALLGEGGMGAVYVAKNVALQKPVALKVLSDQVQKFPGAVERFMREGVSASQVRHPAIVEVYDAGTHNGMPWMAMELLEGESLRDRLDRVGQVPPEEAVAIAFRALSGLAVVHERGIIHRDLKPDNIFLEQGPDGVQVKVLDFGIAKDQVEASNLTGTGTVLGTAFYLAPEQAKDASHVDQRCDIYAMGALLYESMAGRTPYDAPTLTELIAKLFTEEPPDLRTFAPDVPPDIAAVVHRCLEREPAARPQSARELMDLLRNYSSDTRSIATVPKKQPSVSTARRGGVDIPKTVGMQSGAPPHASGGAGSGANYASVPIAKTVGQPSSGGVAASGSIGSYGAGSIEAKRRGGLGLLLVALGGLGIVAVVAALAVGWWMFAGEITADPSPTVTPNPGVNTDITSIQLGVPNDPSKIFQLNDYVTWLNVFTPVLFESPSGKQQVLGLVMVISVRGSGDQSVSLIAINAEDGSQAWQTETVAKMDQMAGLVFGVVGDTIIAGNDEGKIRAFSAETGGPKWEATLSEVPNGICEIRPGQLAVNLADGRAQHFQLSDGAPQVDARRCREEQMVQSKLPTTMNGPYVHGSWSFIEDYEVELGGMEASSAYRRSSHGQTIVFGHKKPGTRVPMAASTTGPTWTTALPDDPLSARENSPEAAAFTQDRVLVGYESKDDAGHVVALRLSDGARLYDTALAPNSNGPRVIQTRGNIAYVAYGSFIEALDIRSGQSLWRNGR